MSSWQTNANFRGNPKFGCELIMSCHVAFPNSLQQTAGWCFQGSWDEAGKAWGTTAALGTGFHFTFFTLLHKASVIQPQQPDRCHLERFLQRLSSNIYFFRALRKYYEARCYFPESVAEQKLWSSFSAAKPQTQQRLCQPWAVNPIRLGSGHHFIL